MSEFEELKLKIAQLELRFEKLSKTNRDDEFLGIYKKMKKANSVEECLKLMECRANTIANTKEKIRKLKQLTEPKKEKVREIIIVKEAEFNMKCLHFCIFDGEPRCEVDMPIEFCTKNCPYATTTKGGYAVNNKGMTIGKRGYVR